MVLMIDLGNTMMKQKDFFADMSWSIMGRGRQFIEKQSPIQYKSELRIVSLSSDYSIRTLQINL